MVCFYTAVSIAFFWFLKTIRFKIAFFKTTIIFINLFTLSLQSFVFHTTRINIIIFIRLYIFRSCGELLLCTYNKYNILITTRILFHSKVQILFVCVTFGTSKGGKDKNIKLNVVLFARMLWQSYKMSETTRKIVSERFIFKKSHKIFYNHKTANLD